MNFGSFDDRLAAELLTNTVKELQLTSINVLLSNIFLFFIKAFYSHAITITSIRIPDRGRRK
jgi:hypothetical protein